MSLTTAICLGESGWACSSLWLVMVVLFFVGAIARRQIVDLMGQNFSLIGATILGELSFIIFYLIFSSTKIAFIVGIVAVFIGGFVGAIWDESDGGGFE